MAYYAFLDENNIVTEVITGIDETELIEGLDTDVILSLDNSKNEYINQMRQQSTWGGAIEIKAASNMWNVKILVHNIRDTNNIIEFLPINKMYRGIINISWNGSHYESLKN